MAIAATEHDIDIFARTIYGEAEANDMADAYAIACVILNRVANKRWPNSIAGVCQQKWQFSCWNEGDPSRARILAATPKDKWFATCQRIAREAAAGKIGDMTQGSTHYYATYIKPPKWAKGKTPVYETPKGKYNHLFFNDIDTPAPRTKKAVVLSGVATAGTVAGAAAEQAGLLEQAKQAGETVGALQPVLPLLQQLGPAMPWVLGAVIIGCVAYFVFSAIQDRRDGGRT